MGRKVGCVEIAEMEVESQVEAACTLDANSKVTKLDCHVFKPVYAHEVGDLDCRGVRHLFESPQGPPSPQFLPNLTALTNATRNYFQARPLHTSFGSRCGLA